MKKLGMTMTAFALAATMLVSAGANAAESWHKCGTVDGQDWGYWQKDDGSKEYVTFANEHSQSVPYVAGADMSVARCESEMQFKEGEAYVLKFSGAVSYKKVSGDYKVAKSKSKKQLRITMNKAQSKVKLKVKKSGKKVMNVTLYTTAAE